MPYRPVVQVNDQGWPTLDAGRCIHPVTIWQRGPSSPPQYDACGAAVPSWQPFTTAMGAIETLRGTELVKAGQDTSRLFVEVTFWYQAGIESNMQVTDENGMTYIIQSVDDVNRRHVVMRLNCLELGSNE